MGLEAFIANNRIENAIKNVVTRDVVKCEYGIAHD
jgi:hypothetical protein